MTDKGKHDSQAQNEDGVWLHCSNTAVRRASRHLGQLYEDAMGDTGLKGTQFSLISQIAGSNQPTLKNLAEAMVMDLSALGHTLKPLIRDGLVELVPDPQDRRAKRVRLTETGAATQRDFTARWQIAQDRFDKAFGKEKSEELRRALAFISSGEFAKAFKRGEEA
ncbi:MULTISPECIES: MarR family winged helix-turn-helix transcriptional regulator [unclassified Neorhizobium]|uniref:MarR family winged helix-turn-helix transcriptional regulator n=1 Tax=unclassified Neorhizobium TaxID=2629175 RepID=UPI001FF13CFC|nr:MULTISPECIES: MarR family winged helix-turn-helix transcriptional regulator [unclassified Neorhizobium]MCJ9674108.1 MarR family winged helix-turn-helix transcriptional regulator [Neorhizobium sp. SHOUNA12B]MCJ9748175.1 MarR family winged helix-turn-helix transcriptional regulator [Neorhizobium sp. SHOUNA12A]